MNYQYIIIATPNDYFSTIYSNLKKYPDIQYISSLSFNNIVERVLYKIHFSSKINRSIKLPFKKIWNYKYKKLVSSNKPVCFIYFSDKTKLLEARIQKYLKKAFPQSKHVLYVQDLIKYSFGEDFQRIKDDFDLILSYDPQEAQEYNINYYPLVYSKTVINNNPTINNSDIYFLGKAKDRSRIILKCLENFQKQGYKCDFNLVGVPKDQQIPYEGLNYIDGMTYDENLEHVLKTRFILEVLQSGAESATLRCNEALIYNKGLITNNKNIKSQYYYSSPQFQYFSNEESLEKIELKEFDLNLGINYEDILDPIRLILYIDNHLKELI